VSFNLLAPVYKRLTTKNALTGRRHREAEHDALWNERLAQTMDFFKSEIYQNAAIIALQEYWLDGRYRQIFEKQFHKHGYECRIMQRLGSKVDAVALAIKTDTFEVCGAENINLCTFGDRVALLLWLRHRSTGFDLLVANTHLSFPHNVLDRMNQVAQMKHLTRVIDQFSHKHKIEKAPVLIMGDFNVEGHSPVCDHLRHSGYYSCFEVCPPANTQPGAVGAATVSEVSEDDLIPVTTHESCILPSDSSAAAELSSTTSSRAAAEECDDVGDDCVEPNSLASQADLPCEPPSDLTTVRTSAGASPIVRTISEHAHRVSYVSHFNHRNEEVGVDHIFLKPLGSRRETDPADESHAWEVVAPATTGDTAGTHLAGDSGNGSSKEHAHAEEPAARQARPTIFVAECQVLPKDVNCSSWYAQFNISDHRPVRAKVIFTQDVQDSSRSI
jgi:endonuclease/exonuclease/phosphatase family metal-dependent hydrolase